MASRRRLLLGYERHINDPFTRMWNALIDAGESGLEVLHAYTVREQLRALLALPTTGDRELISHRLYRFYAQAAASDIPEAFRLAETIETWWPVVLAMGYRNARSAGYNRLAMHVGRNALGVRNPSKPKAPDTVIQHPPTPTAVSQENFPARSSSKPSKLF